MKWRVLAEGEAQKKNECGRKLGDLERATIRIIWYTHKTSGFKTSGFKTSGLKTSGFKTSETSGLQNVRFAKHQVYKTSGLQNVRFTKCQVYKTSGLQNVRLQKNHLYIYSVLVVGGNP